MYKKAGYVDVLNACAKVSMLRAIDEVKALPGYSQSGEVIYSCPTFAFVSIILIFMNSG